MELVDEKGRLGNRKSDRRITKANYEFDVFSDYWELDANKKIYFRGMDSLSLAPDFLDCFKLALADYACELSASYTDNLFRYTKWFFSVGVTDRVLESHVIKYKASLDKENEYKLGYIRGFLLDWHEKEIGGIDAKAIELLNTLKISGNVKGRAVALGCPFSGAYTYEEQADFINFYTNAFSGHQISLSDYAFIMFLQQTGVRPIQITQTYVGDLITRLEGGVEHFDLKIPKGKQRGSYRASFQEKTNVNEDLMLVLMRQAGNSVELVEKHFKIKLNDAQREKVPLFIDLPSMLELRTFEEFEHKMNSQPDYLCMRLKSTPDSVEDKVRRIAHLCPLKTRRIEVEGEFGDLHISPRRFRYTYATNLAIAGANDHVIAEELGQSDTQQVKVYTEFNEDMADRIDVALASSLTPLAQAFAGTLIDSEKNAIRANDPRSRIHSESGSTVGNCGDYGFCASGTIHCYTCAKFQPWLNAKHEEVLKFVTDDRDKKRDLGASEFVLQGANRTIDAIKVVLQMCSDRKLELEKEGSLNV
ncbi:site-specific integrase [Marinomonas sp.]|jgi:hypothetical protein|uniref:site-specific integrase n=1 Tax=Marinomonas sp. TaxID=1904862 RepID=UPI003A932FD9